MHLLAASLDDSAPRLDSAPSQIFLGSTPPSNAGATAPTLHATHPPSFSYPVEAHRWPSLTTRLPEASHDPSSRICTASNRLVRLLTQCARCATLIALVSRLKPLLATAHWPVHTTSSHRRVANDQQTSAHLCHIFRAVIIFPSIRACSSKRRHLAQHDSTDCEY